MALCKTGSLSKDLPDEISNLPEAKEYVNKVFRTFKGYAETASQKLGKAANYIGDSKVGRAAKYVHNSNMEILGWTKEGLENHYRLATLSENGDRPKTRKDAAKNLIKSPEGKLLVGGLIVSAICTGLAATIGHNPDSELPITPAYSGTYYNPIFFPLNPDVTREGVNAVARHVVLGIKESNPMLYLENLAHNLKNNALVYSIPSIPGILVNGGKQIVKGIEKSLNV